MSEAHGFTDSDDRLHQNATKLVVAAHEIWNSLGDETDIYDFIDMFVYPTRDYGKPAPMQFFSEYRASIEKTGEENGRDERFILVRLACAHIGGALRFAADGFRDDAWECLLMAQFTTATLDGVIKTEKKNLDSTPVRINLIATAQARTIISDRARKAADKSHEANRAIRNEAHKWLDDHFHQDGLTNDRAAEALQKIVPMEFSTRMGYVKSWKASR